MSKIWIDLDNSPHVPLFRPIIRALESRGHRVTVTARDCFQVQPLLDLFHLNANVVGRHYGKKKVMKLAGLIIRAIQLLPSARIEEPDIALSHGSRSQLVVARLLGIPSVLMADYEYARWVPGFYPDWLLLPEVMRLNVRQRPRKGVLSYTGIKEDAYIPDFKPDSSILEELGIDRETILVTIRPPATEAHYHNPEAEKLLHAVIEHLGGLPGLRMVIVPRNERQAGELRRAWPAFITEGRLIFPARAVDGLNLIWHSDLVVSGGGTMNREAAALDVPVCTIFRGKLGAVDQHLAGTGRLKLITSEAEARDLWPEKREIRAGKRPERRTLDDIVDCVERINTNVHTFRRGLLHPETEAAGREGGHNTSTG